VILSKIGIRSSLVLFKIKAIDLWCFKPGVNPKDQLFQMLELVGF
jgi:hypothetical protein